MQQQLLTKMRCCTLTAACFHAGLAVSTDAMMRGSTADEPALTGGDAYMSDTVFSDAMYTAAVRSPADDTTAAAPGRRNEVSCWLPKVSPCHHVPV